MDNKIVPLCTIALISIVVVLLTSVARINALSIDYHHRSAEQRGDGGKMNHDAAAATGDDGGVSVPLLHHLGDGDNNVGLDASRSVRRDRRKEVTTVWDTRTVNHDGDYEKNYGDDDDDGGDDGDVNDDDDDGGGGGQDDELVDTDDEDINWTEEDKETLRKRILRSLGLESEPVISKDQIPPEEMAAGYALYRKRVEESERRKASSLVSAQVQQVAPKQGITYTYQDQGTSRPSHVVSPYSDNATTWWLYFPIANLTNGQTTRTIANVEKNSITATLRIHRKSQSGDGSSDDPVSPTTSPIIHLYHVNANDQLLLVDSRPVTSTGHLSYYSWDVSDSVRQWSHDSNLNRGLLVTCSHCDNDLSRLLWRTTDHQSDLTVPSVVVHVTQDSVQLSRSKRNAKDGQDALYEFEVLGGPNGVVDCQNNKKGAATCCRKKLTVNMATLGLDQWVIEPKSFEAYYCQGKCPYKYNPASTHAVIQGYLARAADRKKVKGRHKKVPQPCCAPSELGSVELLIIKNGSLQNRPWDNVVVNKCACS